jgi:hypothetical protein
MSYEPVDLLITDDSLAKLPVPGVVVRVYDETGTVFYAQGETGETGLVSFLLPAPQNFHARFYKFATSFKQPLLLEVLEAPETNAFDVSAHVFLPPEAVDLRLCRCSGFFRGPNGLAAPNVDIHFITKFKPLLLDGSGLLTERLRKKTDQNGYIEVDLIRFGQYEVTIEGLEDQTRCVHVPDAPSTNLPDLLFPVVSRVLLEPAGPYSLGVGDEIVVTPTVYSSDGRLLEGAAIEDVLWSSEDASIALVMALPKSITLRGVAPGTTNIVATRRDSSIVRIPDTPIAGQPVAITVV